MKFQVFIYFCTILSSLCDHLTPICRFMPSFLFIKGDLIEMRQNVDFASRITSIRMTNYVTMRRMDRAPKSYSCPPRIILKTNQSWFGQFKNRQPDHAPPPPKKKKKIENKKRKAVLSSHFGS